ncbi:MAG: hypothetical protein A2096_14515 [Spirochaetes bacterium GWF1_41_5]|nr:MAG: hypothetical protein A2096_14515 [Spirochaetes bacterium GWF1_41_5]HBE03549.1 hypothetical protein [Spirochaetia bacterium]
MPKAGLCLISLQNQDIINAISTASDIGADHIEIWAKPPHLPMPYNYKELDNIKKHADLKKVKICAIGSYLNAGETKYINNTEITIENQIELAMIFNTKLIRIWPGIKDYKLHSNDEKNTVINRIRFFADSALEKGISIVLERHGNTLTNQWDNIPELMKNINHNNVFLNYQIPFPAEADEYRIKSVNDYRNLLPYARHAHLQNYGISVNTGKPERSLLKDGLVDYSKLMSAACAANYDGCFMVEFPSALNPDRRITDLLREDIEFIRAL